MSLAKKRFIRKTAFVLVMIAVAGLIIINANAAPVGPTITMISNSSKPLGLATKINDSINGSTPGGYIFTISLNSRQQNTRWKGYVGNVTGTLALDDSDEYTLYEWTLTTVTGEVYATRASGNINWTGINCTWVADSKTNKQQGLTSNRTPEHDENEALSHTNKDDNITATFAYTNHSSMQIGPVGVGMNECFAAQTWQRDSPQTYEDSNNANFTQVILYDGGFGKIGGNVVYATNIEGGKAGYDGNEVFDFQMILPENGNPSWSSSTAYYFYVELA